jgi:hypothetical protein
MPNLITPPLVKELSNDVKSKIESFGAWAVTAKFQTVLPDVEKCCDEDRVERLLQLVKALGFGTGVYDLNSY